MRKILLVNKTCDIGGIQSSMINMANELSKYYQVDLFLYNPTGILADRLCKDVNVIEPSWRFRVLGTSLSKLVKVGNVRDIAFKIFSALWSIIFDNRLPIKIAINHQCKLAGYDLAIAYHHEAAKKNHVSGFSRFVDCCVDAKKKVAWMHYDNATIDLDSAFNNPFYEKMDKVMFVSRALRDSFVAKHKQFEAKADYCYNFMLYDNITDMSEQMQEVAYPHNSFVCYSACRLSPVKAIVRTIDALKDVFANNSDLYWYIAGEGPERTNIENAISEHNLEDKIILLGKQSNPYPYMKNADLVLNVSYHEAAPMTFMESKAVGTPVFATRTSSVNEFIDDGLDSFICENTVEGIHDRFISIIENRGQVDDAKMRLSSYHASNSDSLSKISYLLES